MISLAVAIALVGVGVGCALIWWMPGFVVRRRAAAAGVTFESASMASLAAISTIALELSTLTTGELKVVAVDAIDPDHERNLRWFAGALGHAANDPVGRAVAKLATRGRLSDVHELPGLGISGSVDRHPVRIGAPGWIGAAPGAVIGTPVGVEVDARVLGFITLMEAVREDAVDSVAALGELGVSAVVLEGTRPDVARDVADEVGLPVVGSSTDPVASADGLCLPDGVVGLADPGVASVAAAISIARRFLGLKRICLIVGVTVAALCLAAAAVLGVVG